MVGLGRYLNIAWGSHARPAVGPQLCSPHLLPPLASAVRHTLRRIEKGRVKTGCLLRPVFVCLLVRVFVSFCLLQVGQEFEDQLASFLCGAAPGCVSAFASGKGGAAHLLVVWSLGSPPTQ